MSDAVTVSYTGDQVRALKHGNDVLAAATVDARSQAAALKRKLAGTWRCDRDPETDAHTITFPLVPA